MAKPSRSRRPRATNADTQTGGIMSQDPIDDTKSKLAELEQRIKAARSSLGEDRPVASEAKQDWDRMVRAHADICRKLEGDHSAEALENARLDIDVLRNSFERWMARVESRFHKGPDKV
jgi:hypothetical protein